MKDRTPERAWSTPWDAPLVPDFPFTFRNIEVLTLTYRTEMEAVRALLPPPLEPLNDWVLIHIYNMNDVEWLGAYHECNVMIGASLDGRIRGGYSPYLFLDSDVGLAHGREVHGQPKKYGEALVEIRKDLVVGTLQRNGITVITGTLPTKQRRGSLEALKQATFDFAVNINYKVIPQIDGRTAIRQLTSRLLADVSVAECWEGPCTVELRPNAQAPVYRLPVRAMGTGYHWKGEFTLKAGEIIHEYRQ